MLYAGSYCGLFNPITYNLSSEFYGLGVEPSIEVEGINYSDPHQFTVSNCSLFDYNLKLKNCQEGKLTGFEVDFSGIPDGITIISSALIEHDGYVIAQDEINPLLYNITTNDPGKYLNI